jgi:hypothetical protein
MKHVFEVGSIYRNRKGEYQVLEINDQLMLIRFLDGEIVSTTVDLQARIREHIMIEESANASGNKMKGQPITPIKRRPKRIGKDFHGFEEKDFKEGVTGSSWRTKTNLGGLLALQLSEGTQEEWVSSPVYRRAVVYIAQSRLSKKEQGVRKAKFKFGLSERRAEYGFYIEKNDGPMDESWDWLRFMAALEQDELLCRNVEHVIRKYELEWEAYIWNKQEEGSLAMAVQVTADGLMMRHFLDNWVDEFSCERFFSALNAIDEHLWCDLYLLSKMEKESAIQEGVHIATLAAEIYMELMPLYIASTRA